MNFEKPSFLETLKIKYLKKCFDFSLSSHEGDTVMHGKEQLYDTND